MMKKEREVRNIEKETERVKKKVYVEKERGREKLLKKEEGEERGGVIFS